MVTRRRRGVYLNRQVTPFGLECGARPRVRPSKVNAEKRTPLGYRGDVISFMKWERSRGGA